MLPLARLLVSLASLTMALAGVPAVAANDAPAEPADWVVLVYGGSDNDSEESFCPDMEDLRRGLAPASTPRAATVAADAPRAFMNGPG